MINILVPILKFFITNSLCHYVDVNNTF